MPCGHEAHLALSLVLNCSLRRPTSRWHGYLQSLPSRPVPIALLWDAFGDEDGREARQWISGTEIEKELCGEDGVDLLSDIREYYSSTVWSVLPASTRSGFLHAYSLVSSRVFLVDAFHGLSMVPIADAFNHTTENDVHLESDFDVCPTCGSLAECPHDRDDAPSFETFHSLASTLHAAASTDTCDMVTNRSIEASSEVFNTYGSHLGNSALIARYGFALEGNENDTITWELSEDDLLGDDCATPASEFVRLFADLAKAWMRSKWSLATEGSTLVYMPDLDNGADRTFVGRGSALRMNSDAQISIQLWLYVALRCILAIEQQKAEERAPHVLDVDELVPLLGQVMDEEIRLEEMAFADGEDGAAERLTEEGQDLLVQIALTVCALCQRRIGRMGKHPALSSSELGELLDTLMDSRTKTRLAITHVLAERSMLESCAETWRELDAPISAVRED